MKSNILDTGLEALQCSALQRPAPYYAKVLENLGNGPGYWDSLRVGVFERPSPDTASERYWEPRTSDSDKQVGEYKRSYSALYRTFHPFQLRGKWYALYSSDYTATRLMELPSCKDIGGEEGDSWGFCPVDYWVPPLHYIESLHDEGCPRDERRGKPDYTRACTCTIVHNPDCNFVTKEGNGSCNACQDKWDEYHRTHHMWHFPDRVHGFVAGCVWGDDSSWKIQYLDLSRADEGILKREERFGYIEMASALDLDKAVRLEAYDHGMSLTISVQKHFDLATGKEAE